MSLALPYSFPRPSSQEQEQALVPKEVLISKNLEFEHEPLKVSPRVATEPYVKTFSHSNSSTPESLVIPLEDPIDDIFQESRQLIENFEIQLPTARFGADSASGASPKRIESDHVLLRKRSRAVLEQVPQKNLDFVTNIPVHSPVKTPTHSPLRNVPSSSTKKSKADRLSTPIAEQKIRGQRKLSFGMSKQKLVPQGVEDLPENISMVDPLACHADNIMRMAMDSTMLGSFCNNSFSSNFSNVLDDSIIRRPPGAADESLCESSRKVLDPLRAMKVEISAADLEQAINDPFRLN